jgi:hypothetical protein
MRMPLCSGDISGRSWRIADIVSAETAPSACEPDENADRRVNQLKRST